MQETQGDIVASCFLCILRSRVNVCDQFDGLTERKSEKKYQNKEIEYVVCGAFLVCVLGLEYWQRPIGSDMVLTRTHRQLR